MEVQVEADQRSRRRVVLCIWQLVDIDRKHRDLVVMRLVAGRRTWATIPVGAEIGSNSGSPPWASTSSSRRRRPSATTSRRRNIEHHPVPPAAAGRRIRIIDAHGEALGTTGGPAPAQDGETLLPVQPNPLNTCSLAMVPPSLISGAGQDHALRCSRARAQSRSCRALQCRPPVLSWQFLPRFDQPSPVSPASIFGRT